MATPPLKAEISDTYPNPTNAVARAGFGKLYDYVTGLLGATGNAAEARAAIGAVNIAGDTLTGLLKFKTGTAIASAATINLSTATGNTAHITGTTAISAVTMSNGQVMDVVFDGILTLTHNSTTNKLPSGANITTAAGDAARYFYDGTTTFCLSYTKSSGESVIAVASVPVGAVIDFSGTSAPTGFLSCPVSATNISRTTYASLFAAIGTTWGVGDGSTTFGMPWFPADYVASQASGNVGTQTAGANISHTHSASQAAHSHSAQMTGGNAGAGSGRPVSSDNSSGYVENLYTSSAAPAITVNANGGAANLSAGVRLLKCVKY